jgi:hypothetical protein
MGTPIQWCPRCYSTTPVYEFSEQELSPLYVDYRQDSYDRDRLSVEPGYASYGNLKNDPTIRAERDRLSSGFLKRNLEPLDSALDYGGGDGWYTPSWVIENFEHTGVLDISPLELVDSRLYRVTELRNHYDLILCQHVLEHIGNPLELMKKLVGCCDYLYLDIPLEGWTEPPPCATLHEHLNFFQGATIPEVARVLGLIVIDSEVGRFEMGYPATLGRYLLRCENA